MTDIQENHCQELYDHYQKLLNFVHEVENQGCGLIAGIDCLCCKAHAILKELGEIK